MKTTMKQIAAGTILALLIIAGNVQAKGTEVTTTGLETVEVAMELENWMIDDNIWNKRPLTWVADEADENLRLESWMTSEMTWEVNNSNTKTVIEKENTLKLENWMINENTWRN